MFSFEFFCCLCFCMCLFDCKCKSLKRLGENITNRKKHKNNRKQLNKKKNRNTVFPAHEPPRIIRVIYSWRFVGWIYCIFLVLWVFLLFLCFFVLCFRLVFLSFCMYNRKNTYTNITKHITNRRKTTNTEQQQKKKQQSPSQTLRYIYFSRSGRGLDILYFCFCYICFS